MPRVLKSKRRKVAGISRTHIHELQQGTCFFRTGFLDDREAMEEAWQDPAVRRRVWARHEQETAKWKLAGRDYPVEPWAASEFDAPNEGGEDAQ